MCQLFLETYKTMAYVLGSNCRTKKQQNMQLHIQLRQSHRIHRYYFIFAEMKTNTCGRVGTFYKTAVKTKISTLVVDFQGSTFLSKCTVFSGL